VVGITGERYGEAK